jgi:hypothetical protein
MQVQRLGVAHFDISCTWTIYPPSSKLSFRALFEANF